MNSYEIIINGLKNESSDSQIIDTLQEGFPNSQIENNIFIIEETKLLLESSTKVLSTEIKSDYFLVKKGKEYIDVNSGRLFNEYKEKTYANCNHGLCKKMGTLVLKNPVKNKDAYIPSVLIATNEKQKENNIIKIKFQNENKKQQIWEFDSQEINECMKCIDEGKNDRQISVALFCPRECVQKLIKHIDINQKMSRSRNGGNNKSSNRASMGRRETDRKTRRKNRSNNL